MNLKIVRSVYNNTSTMGKMYRNDSFCAFTVEDQFRGINDCSSKETRMSTAIEHGNYEVVLNFSRRFCRYMPLLLNVKDYHGVRIHAGNMNQDTYGCILIGEGGDMRTRIWNCPIALVKLVAAIKAVEMKEKIWLEIINE